jgi:hypothetical protein
VLSTLGGIEPIAICEGGRPAVAAIMDAVARHIEV